MTLTWLDLALFTGAVYGLAWLITKSNLHPRDTLLQKGRLRHLDILRPAG